jgi:hypothetical protein
MNLFYDGKSGTIQSATVSDGEHTLGDLILVWGTPTGLIQHRNMVVEVFWASRGAYLTPCSFGPTSRIWLIDYGDSQETPAPWHGFRTLPDLCKS